MTHKPMDLKVAGVILAGGKALRMGGIPKGMLRAGGDLSFIERLVAHMALAGIEEIAISANDDGPYSHLGCAIVADGRVDAGPLAGIEAVLVYFADRYDAVLCVPCDLPGLSSREMSSLIAAFAESGGPVVFAETEGPMPHPLCAVLRPEVREHVSTALDEGAAGVGDLWRRLGGLAVPFNDSRAFSNVNGPDDMDVWLGIHGRSQQLSGIAHGYDR